MVKNPMVHVVPEGGGWAVTREDDDQITSFHPTQAQAAEAGRNVARKDKTGFLLHAKDGRIRARRNYGEDSFRPGHGELDSRAAESEDKVTGESGNAARTDGATAGDEHYEGGGEDMGKEQHTGGFVAVRDRLANYNVYDPNRERIGQVDALFLDENDDPEYVGVRMGVQGTRSTLLPCDLVYRVDEEGERVEVTADKETARGAPTFGDESEITPQLEEEVRRHYGLGWAAGPEERGAYKTYPSDAETPATRSAGTVGAGMTMGDTESGGFRGHARDQEGVGQPGRNLQDTNELRVQRSEEELVAGTREREAGAIKVRKRVRVDRERIEVPTRREEVSVERVPVSGRATGAQIGEDEVSVPVTEEEVVVEKRPVAKEEVRIRKDVVEGTEVVEEDVRREEVDVEDATKTRRPRR